MAVTHVVDFMFGIDVTKIMSPEKIEGLKYLLGTNDEQELLNRYLGFIASKVRDSLMDQKDVAFMNVSVHTKEAFDAAVKGAANQQQAQTQPPVEMQQQKQRPEENIEHVSQHNDKYIETLLEEENKLINDIKAAHFELVSGAKDIKSLHINNKYRKNDALIHQIKEVLEDKVPLVFDSKVKTFQFKSTYKLKQQGE